MPRFFTHAIHATRIRRHVAVCLLACMATLAANKMARAQNVAVAFSGTINAGYTDTAGLFGPVGGDLSNHPFSISMIYNPGDFQGGTIYWSSGTAGAMTTSVTINGISLSYTNSYSPEMPTVQLSFESGVEEVTNLNSVLSKDPSGLFCFYCLYLSNDALANPFTGGPNHMVFFQFGVLGYNGLSPLFDRLAGTIGGLAFINPFLLDTKNLGNLDLATILPNQTTPDSATALAADGTSAAIVLFQVPTMDPVTFTTNNGTTLFKYEGNHDFFKKSPTVGDTKLEVKPISIGSVIYAIALLQAPLAGATPAYSTPITITAQQKGGQMQQAYLPLVPPPVVLVHGIWGDQSSLSSLQTYLAAQTPWSSNPAFVSTLCYSKYLKFDAASDPLTNGQPCEITSKVALQTTITPLLGELNGQGIVVGRVDVVAHSMGDLAARNYASQSFYRSEQNRGEGQFHTVVTLDTPEIGSQLASFLIANRNTHRKRAHDIVWTNFCGQGVTGPISYCFDEQGLPIVAPGLPLNSGAVYSLIPTSQSLKNPKLAPPGMADTLWLAVSAVAPSNSATEDLLNDLLKEITAESDTPPTITSILQTSSHDAIVTTESQTSGSGLAQVSSLQNLSHTSLSNNSIVEKLITKFGWNDSSVTNDPSGSVNELVVCWLKTVGSAICNPAQAEELLPKDDPGVNTVNPSSIADYPLQVVAPSSVDLGKPTELKLHLDRTVQLKNIQVAQREDDGDNHGPLDTVLPTRVDGSDIYLTVTPSVLGKTTFRVNVDSADGKSVWIGDAKTYVRPTQIPTSFKVSSFPRLYIDPDAEEPILVTAPTATFDGVSGRLSIPPEFLTFNLAAGSPSSVVSVSKTGVIRGLKEGVVTVEVHLGSAVDSVQVVVQHRPS